MIWFFGTGFIFLAGALIVRDLREGYLPNAFVAGVFILGISKSIICDMDILPALASASLLFFGALFLKKAYARLRHKEGLGLGDVKLFGALGPWLFIQEIPLFLFFVGGCGVLWGIGARLYSNKESFAFAPAIYAGYALTITTRTCNFL